MFSVVDGDLGLEAFATVDKDWFADERRASREAIRRRMLRQWRFVYDQSYRWDKAVRRPNFDVWVSGFTNQPIPTSQMQAWLDAGLAQLRRVRHARVLDIGCGVGLVLAALAPGGATYEGIDLSEEAIASLGAWAATQDDLRHVRLIHGAAHEIQGRDGDPVDLAVLNSVVQYFPDRDYLIEVLQGAALQIAPGGSIFLGDLRAPALLPMRALNVAAAQADAEATTAHVRAEAELILASTRELSVDPGFFQALGENLPRLAHVQFALKPASIDRDLAGYRYDALLRLDSAKAPPAPVLQAASLEIIQGKLASDRPPCAVLQGLPNARLAKDAALARVLQSAQADTPLARLINLVEPLEQPGIEPEVLARTAGALGYAAELRFTPGAGDGRFDVLLRREGVEARWPDVPLPDPVSNDPLGAELMDKLRRELHRALEAATDGAPLAKIELSAPGA